MTAAQFRTVLERLGLSQGKAAAFLGVSLRTAHGYANGEHPIPEATAKLLRLMAHHNLGPGEIK